MCVSTFLLPSKKYRSNKLFRRNLYCVIKLTIISYELYLSMMDLSGLTPRFAPQITKTTDFPANLSASY